MQLTLDSVLLNLLGICLFVVLLFGVVVVDLFFFFVRDIPKGGLAIGYPIC